MSRVQKIHCRLQKYTHKKKGGLDRKEVCCFFFFSLIIFMTSPTQQIELLETSNDRFNTKVQ